MRSLTNDKKGSITDPFIMIVAGFIILILSAVFLFGFTTLSDNLIAIDTSSTTLNFSDAANTTIGNIARPLQQLKWLVIGVFMAFGISIFISNFFVRANSAFFFLYVMITGVLVVFSIFISRAYENILLQPGTLSTELNSFFGASWLFLNLPVIMTVFGFMGAVFLYINIDRGGQGESGFA